MKKRIVNILIVILCGVMVFCGWKLWEIQSEYKQAAETFDNLTQYIAIPDMSDKAVGTETEQAVSESEGTTEGPQHSDDGTVWPVVDFESLKQINPDIVGWIYIEGTAVNYPIVQGDDNNFYLRRLIDGTWNSSGTIFLDCDAEADFSGRNSVIYGHNMRNGTMFRPLTGYKKQEFYEDHPVALLMTPGGNYKIRFFSGYVGDLADSAWDLFFTDDAYSQWLCEITEKSYFESGIIPEMNDRIVTLSTCSYEFDNARFVLHGIIE